MSGPQHIAWYETAMQELHQGKLLDLQVTMPKDEHGFTQVKEMLEEMASRK